METQTKIHNIKLKDYLSGKYIEYSLFISSSPEFVAEINAMDIMDLYELPFGLIKDIQRDLENESLQSFGQQFEYLKRVLMCQYSDDENKVKHLLDEVTLIDACNTISFLFSSIRELLDNEQIVLKNDRVIKQEEVDAGIEDFSKLGVYSQLRYLADNDVTKIADVRKVKYGDCLLELYARKLDSTFETNLREIYNRNMNLNK